MHRRMFLRTVMLGAPAMAIAGCVPDEGAYYGPAYGNAAYYYDYYPAANVYYYPTAQIWYYPHGGRWLRATHLPPHYRISARDRRRIYHSGRYPYERNQDHRRGRFQDPPRETRDERREDRREDRRDDRRDERGGYRRDSRDGRRDERSQDQTQARAEQDARRTDRQTRRDDRQEARQARRETAPQPGPDPVAAPDPIDYRSGPPGPQYGVR